MKQHENWVAAANEVCVMKLIVASVMQFDRDAEINAKGQVNARPVTEVNSTFFVKKTFILKKR